MQNAVQQSHDAAHGHGKGNGPQADRIARYVVDDEKTHNHGCQRDDTLNRKINAAHENNESGAHAQNDWDGCGIQQPDKISKGEKITIEQAYENAQRKEYRNRRPSAPMPKESSVQR